MDDKLLPDKVAIPVEKSLEILMNELENLRELFIHSENGIQNLFNFYLAFITASVGGTVIITQVSPASNIVQAQHMLGGLLLVIALIGVMYTGSLSHRYANMGRYAQGMDELRRYLLSLVDFSLPLSYQPFIQGYLVEHSRLEKIRLYLTVGTYHTYTIIINSLCCAASIWLLSYDLLTAWDIRLQIVLFISSFFILFLSQSLYGRFLKNSMVRDSGLSLNVYRVRVPVNINSSGE